MRPAREVACECVHPGLRHDAASKHGVCDRVASAIEAERAREIRCDQHDAPLTFCLECAALLRSTERARAEKVAEVARNILEETVAGDGTEMPPSRGTMERLAAALREWEEGK
jgi:hypothetical protein